LGGCGELSGLPNQTYPTPKTRHYSPSAGPFGRYEALSCRARRTGILPRTSNRSVSCGSSVARWTDSIRRTLLRAGSRFEKLLFETRNAPPFPVEDYPVYLTSIPDISQWIGIQK
jgi:hypothetical protein